MGIPSILVIEDEKTLACNIRRYLKKFNYDVAITNCGNDAINQLVVTTPDLVLLDLKLPDMDGMDILSHIRQIEPKIKVIMMTAFGDVETAVAAMKAGASDFLTKPLKLATLKELMERILQKSMDVPGDSTIQMDTLDNLGGLIGKDPAMLKVKQKITQLLDSESRVSLIPPPVLVTGQTGTGKELVARALHFQGLRAQARFLSLRGSMITPGILHRKRLFNEHAQSEYLEQNIFAGINGGTLFLDEIADTSLEVQAKLVDLISERGTDSSGQSVDRDIDIRVIASTSRSLEDLVHTGEFRSDLYFRLHVIKIHLPTLCQRKDDILLLADHFLSILAQRYGKSLLRFDSEAKAGLISYTWPGNVRELRNLIEQAVLAIDGNIVGVSDLDIPNSESKVQNPEQTNTPEFSKSNYSGLRRNKKETERESLVAALDRAAWNVSLAARILGISRDTVRYRIKKHNLTRPQTW